MRRFYLVYVWGCVNPSTMGPYETDEDRDVAALKTHEEMDENDALFWLDIADGEPQIGSYTGGFFEGDSEY